MGSVPSLTPMHRMGYEIIKECKIRFLDLKKARVCQTGIDLFERGDRINYIDTKSDTCCFLYNRQYYSKWSPPTKISVTKFRRGFDFTSNEISGWSKNISTGNLNEIRIYRRQLYSIIRNSSISGNLRQLVLEDVPASASFRLSFTSLS